MEIRPIAAPDRAPLAALLDRIETFSREEVVCALELIDSSIQGSAEYHVFLADRDGEVVGYICYGPTPMTDGTYDLYWIATDPKVRGQGVGASLVAKMESEIRRRNGRMMRVETSAMEAYGPTHGFYGAMKYQEASRFRDFYKEGEDLIILFKRM